MAAGTRFLQSIGGVALSFYDWYADLPPASPQTFGDQTDVPESGDWYNSSYLMMWGSNIPVTRTPDAHFMVESRYKGTKVVVVSPDFADNTKFADEWARIEPGSDAALAFAMGHVILKKFHVERQEPYFLNYMRKYTDSPFLVTLDKREDGTYTPGKFLTASQVSDAELNSSPNATHRGLVMEEDGKVVDPGGTVADRWDNNSAKWNLSLDNADPVMSIAETDSFETAEVLFPRFDLDADPADIGTDKPVGTGIVHRGVPVRRVDGKLVTTVFDVMLAHYGVNREELNLPGSWPKDFYDASEVGTPAWQEGLTGVPADTAIRIGREFAQNAADSKGRSQIIMGAGCQPLLPRRYHLPHLLGADLDVRYPGCQRWRLGSLRGPGEAAPYQRLDPVGHGHRLAASSAPHDFDRLLLLRHRAIPLRQLPRLPSGIAPGQPRCHR